jgi:hypothetical protein
MEKRGSDWCELDQTSKMHEKLTDEVMQRHLCLDTQGEEVEVIEYRHMLEVDTPRGFRRYPGARHWALSSGEKVRVIDSTMFEVLATEAILFRKG